MMFENTLRCTGRSLFMQLPIFPLLTAVKRRANTELRINFELFFFSRHWNVSLFFQHLLQINNRGCSNTMGNFKKKLHPIGASEIRAISNKQRNCRHFFTNTNTPEAVQDSLSNGNIAVGFAVSKIDSSIIKVTRFGKGTTDSIAWMNFTRGHTFTN